MFLSSSPNLMSSRLLKPLLTRSVYVLWISVKSVLNIALQLFMLSSNMLVSPSHINLFLVANFLPSSSVTIRLCLGTFLVSPMRSSSDAPNPSYSLIKSLDYYPLLRPFLWLGSSGLRLVMPIPWTTAVEFG